MAVTTLPIICYDNLLEIGTTTGDGVYPANAYDWLTGDYWTTSAASGFLETTLAPAASADYLAIFGHNLKTVAATIKLQYWTGAAYDDVPGATITPGEDERAYVVFFTSVSSTKYKVVVTTDGNAATLAVVAHGARTEMERGAEAGFMPPRFARRDVITNIVAQNGQRIGSTLVRGGVSGALSLSLLTAAWVRSTLDPFIEHARGNGGWFLAWNPSGYSAEAAYCWATDTPQVSLSDPGLMSTVIVYDGRVK